MGKYIKKFDTHSDYEDFIETEDFIKPNVSYCVDNIEVHYNPIIIPNYLRFTALEDNSTLQLKGWDDNEYTEITPTANIEYSYDGFNFTTYNYTEITLSEGETVYLRGNNPNGFSTHNDNQTHHYFATPTGSFECHGNVMSLLYGEDFETSPNAYVIPNNGCFYSLFCETMDSYGCNITTAPELPATTLTNGCYEYMFCGCRNLTAPPMLSATTLTESCYASMFYRCSNLTTAPELPATTLANACYGAMFYYCLSLVIAPVLPAPTLTQYCYRFMFNSCTSLNSITCLATDKSALGCTQAWVTGVAASGTFTKAASMNSWTTGTSDIPSGWTVQNATE